MSIPSPLTVTGDSRTKKLQDGDTSSLHHRENPAAVSEVGHGGGASCAENCHIRSHTRDTMNTCCDTLHSTCVGASVNQLAPIQTNTGNAFKGATEQAVSSSRETCCQRMVLLNGKGEVQQGRRVDLLQEAGYSEDVGALPDVSTVSSAPRSVGVYSPVNTEALASLADDSVKPLLDIPSNLESIKGDLYSVGGAVEQNVTNLESSLSMQDIQVQIAGNDSAEKVTADCDPEPSKLFENFFVMDGLPFEVEEKKDNCSGASVRDINAKGAECTDSMKRSTPVSMAIPATSDDAVIQQNTENTCSAHKQEDSIDDAVAGSHFSRIPNELVQKILSYVSVEDLCLRVALVCRKWKQFAYDPIHWTELSVSACTEISSYQLAQLVLRVPFLRKLSLHGKFDLDADEVLYIARCCPQLRELDLGFVVTVDSRCFFNIAHHCKHLEVLNVEGCVLVNDSCIRSICEPHCLPNLRSLNLSHCTELNGYSLELLAENKHKLSSLNIDGIPWISDQTIIDFVMKLGDNMERLWLDGAEMADGCIRHIAECCSRLTLLSLSFAELLTDVSLQYIKTVTTLTDLTIRKGPEFSALALQEFFSGGALRNLRRLDLSECTQLGDDGVAALTECCGAGLTHLSLCWCWYIQDVGIQHIVDKCRNLEFLDLTGIDKITGRCFNDVLTRMPFLTFLDLKQCNKIDDGLILEVVRKSKNRLKVMDYYGNEFNDGSLACAV